MFILYLLLYLFNFYLLLYFFILYLLLYLFIYLIICLLICLFIYVLCLFLYTFAYLFLCLLIYTCFRLVPVWNNFPAICLFSFFLLVQRNKRLASWWQVDRLYFLYKLAYISPSNGNKTTTTTKRHILQFILHVQHFFFIREKVHLTGW